MSTIQEMVDFMETKDYPFNHLIFMADETSAGVLEQNIGSPVEDFDTQIRNFGKGFPGMFLKLWPQ